MINYARFKKQLNVSDRSLRNFTEVVQMAECQQKKKYMTILDMFCKEKNAEALEQAQRDVKVMDWDEIRSLCTDFEISVDLAISRSKEDRHDWRAMEDKMERSI